MPIKEGGLVKLLEELGELSQVAAKKIAYQDGDLLGGNGDLLKRMEEEMGDVLAAIDFVASAYGLDIRSIQERRALKLAQLSKQGTEPEACPSCGDTHIVRHSTTPSGTQRYRCRSCGKTFSPKKAKKMPLTSTERSRRSRARKKEESRGDRD